jgi:hypothetical protein
MPSSKGFKTNAVLPFSILALPLMATALIKTIPQTVEKNDACSYNPFEYSQRPNFDKHKGEISNTTAPFQKRYVF